MGNEFEFLGGQFNNGVVFEQDGRYILNKSIFLFVFFYFSNTT